MGRKRTGRTVLFTSIWIVVTGALLVVAGEVFLLVVNPQATYYPRWEFSPQYSLVLPKNTTIVHKRPGRWEFKYTMNEHGCRGKAIPISNSYEKANVIVLGDSYTQGAGVNDGEEFAAVIGRDLKGRVDVINTGIGGWGLTQQIRRFYEFGQVYDPAIVILVFCSNDPDDNLAHPVTTVRNGKFEFRNVSHRKGRLQKALSKSYIVQHSQLYSLFRSVFVSRRRIPPRGTPDSGVAPATESDRPITEAERIYNELLEAFALDLRAKGIHFLMISANVKSGRSQLDRVPYIKKKVTDLESRGLLNYVAIEGWFEDEEDMWSPEGHWGKGAHRIIGQNLSRIIEKQYLTSR